MIQAQSLEFPHPGFVHPLAGGNEVAVIAQLGGFGDQRLQIVAQTGFAAGKTQLGRAQSTRFAQHSQPFPGVQFGPPGLQFQGIAAIGALQRTAVGQFRE